MVEHKVLRLTRENRDRTKAWDAVYGPCNLWSSIGASIIHPVGRIVVNESIVTDRNALIKRARAIIGVRRRPLKIPSSEESLEGRMRDKNVVTSQLNVPIIFWNGHPHITKGSSIDTFSVSHLRKAWRGRPWRGQWGTRTNDLRRFLDRLRSR